MIVELNRWLEVVREDDMDKVALVSTTRDLKVALDKIRVALPGDDYPHKLHPLFGEAHQIITALVDLSGSFLWDNYTDSLTDGPCDIEWDIHHLQKALDPSYVIPDDIEPAYVLPTAFPPPPDEED